MDWHSLSSNCCFCLGLGVDELLVESLNGKTSTSLVCFDFGLGVLGLGVLKLPVDESNESMLWFWPFLGVDRLLSIESVDELILFRSLKRCRKTYVIESL